MRNPARIDRILARLREYWNANPDLRLGQIVSNLTPKRYRGSCLCGHFESCAVCTGESGPDPFHVEDSEWEKILDDELAKL